MYVRGRDKGVSAITMSREEGGLIGRLLNPFLRHGAAGRSRFAKIDIPALRIAGYSRALHITERVVTPPLGPPAVKSGSSSLQIELPH